MKIVNFISINVQGMKMMILKSNQEGKVWIKLILMAKPINGDSSKLSFLKMPRKIRLNIKFSS